MIKFHLNGTVYVDAQVVYSITCKGWEIETSEELILQDIKTFNFRRNSVALEMVARAKKCLLAQIPDL